MLVDPNPNNIFLQDHGKHLKTIQVVLVPSFFRCVFASVYEGLPVRMSFAIYAYQNHHIQLKAEMRAWIHCGYALIHNGRIY